MKKRNINDIIKKYPKIFKDYEGNSGRCNWYCPEGWIDILDDLCGAIQNRTDNYSWGDGSGEIKHYDQVECLQVKEKFAGLRFYTRGHDNVVGGMICAAEYLCNNTCMICGSRKNVAGKSICGWYFTLCDKCFEKETKKRNKINKIKNNLKFFWKFKVTNNLKKWL